MLAEENRINLRLLAPRRGRILDRFGVPLAANDQNYRIVLVAEQAGDLLDPERDRRWCRWAIPSGAGCCAMSGASILCLSWCATI